METALPVLQTPFAFDARGVAKRFRHAAIFGALESLDDGDTMRFVNDHDPQPLIAQMRQRYGNQVTIQANAPADELPPLEQSAGGGCGGGGCGCAGSH
jgi:uncharacterized protein (DUF2249 family)